MDRLQRFNEYLGFARRMREAIDAEQEGKWLGRQYGDIPVLGGALRPLGLAANTAGLGMEAMGTAGKAIGGLAAIPFVYGEAWTGSAPDSPGDTIRSRAMVDQGIGNMLQHPGRTIDALRHSENDITSYLAGILEMVSDPTNVVSAGVSGAVRAGRAAATARRLGAGASLSEDFLAATGREAAQQFADDAALAARSESSLSRLEGALTDQGARQEAWQAGRLKVNSARKDMLDVQGETNKLREALNQQKSDWNTAEKLGDEEIKKARAAGGYFEPLQGIRKSNPVYQERADFNKEMRAEIRGKVFDQLGIDRDFKAYTNDTYKALMDAQAEEGEVVRLYNEALRAAPKREFRDKGFNVIKRPHKNALSEVNGVMNADPGLAQGIGRSALDDPNFSDSLGVKPDSISAPWDDTHGNTFVTAKYGAEAGTPEAVAEVADRVQEAANLPPPPEGPLHGPDMPEARDITPDDVNSTLGRMNDLIRHTFIEGLREQRAAMQRSGTMLNFSQLASVWKGVTTQTLRNIFMDEGYSRVMAADAGIRRAEFTRAKDYIVRRLTEAEGGEYGKENPLMLLGDVSDVLGQMGIGKGWTKKQIKEFYDAIGVNPFEAETENIRNISAMQHLLGGSIVGLANPIRATVGALTLPLGYLGPMRQRMFHIVNNVTHMAAKGEAFKQGFLPYLENSAKTLLSLAEAEGKDVSALRGWGMEDGFGGMYLREGAFSPERVTMVLGDRYGEEWRRMVAKAMQAGLQRATDVYGNYAQRSVAERTIDKFFPFMSWSWRNYTRVGRMVLSHPAVLAGTIQLMEAELEDAKANNRPGYQALTVGINRDTPFVGVLARVFSPGQEAEVRINPMALFMPFSSEGVATLAGADSESADTAYQKFEKLAGIAGLSPAPIIQAGAYATGLDYQTPGPLSRYASIDQMWDDLGINSEVPSIAQQPLLAARAKLSPLVASSGLGQAMGAEADPNPRAFDPVATKANELVYEATGHPISDPRNRMIAAEIATGDSDYLDVAERLVDVQGGGRAAFNAISPISASVVSETTTNRRKGGKPPFAFNEISDMRDNGQEWLADMMQATNDEWYRTHPEAAINKRPKITAADKTIVIGQRRRALRQALGLE